MAGFIIGSTEVADPAALAEYLGKVGPIVERYGGRFVAAGPDIDVLEGDSSPDAVVVIEFDSAGAARRWYESPEYVSARQARHRSGRSTVILLDTQADRDTS